MLFRARRQGVKQNWSCSTESFDNPGALCESLTGHCARTIFSKVARCCGSSGCRCRRSFQATAKRHGSTSLSRKTRHLILLTMVTSNFFSRSSATTRLWLASSLEHNLLKFDILAFLMGSVLCELRSAYDRDVIEGLPRINWCHKMHHFRYHTNDNE